MKDLVVCKFGGSSVADAQQFQKIKTIVDSDKRRRIIVVSAPGKRHETETKLTDLFYSTYDLATKHLDFSEPWKHISDRYLEIVADLGVQSEVQKDLNLLQEQLKSLAQEITEDFLVSRGEFLCARIMAEFLNAEFVDAFPLIQFNNRYKVSDESYRNIAETINTDKITVIPGFYGANTKGEVKTFSRGGSDITGSILAKACDATLYENWTDVSGLLMANPNIVENPLPMTHVSYAEIRELAYSGASVLHDEAITPCRDKNIPISIKNTNKPADAGTLIIPQTDKYSHVITGVAGRKGFAMLHVEKFMMNKERGFGRRLMVILEELNLSWELAPAGIDSKSEILEQSHFEKVESEVLEKIQQQLNVDLIKVSKDIALIATVGHGMTNKIGVAATLFQAIAEAEINIRIIDQGSSEINIIIGVDHCDFENAINTIYRAFMS